MKNIYFKLVDKTTNLQYQNQAVSTLISGISHPFAVFKKSDDMFVGLIFINKIKHGVFDIQAYFEDDTPGYGLVAGKWAAQKCFNELDAVKIECVCNEHVGIMPKLCGAAYKGDDVWEITRQMWDAGVYKKCELGEC